MPDPAPPIAYSNGATTATPSQLLPWSDGGGSPYQGEVTFEPSGAARQIVFGPQSPYQSIEEIYAGRTGTSWSAVGPRTYIRRFRVILKRNTEYRNNVFMGPVGISQCPGIPKPYSPYIPYRLEEWDSKALAIDIGAAQEKDDDSLTWIVTISYSTDMPPGGPRFGNTNLGWFDIGDQNQPWMIPPALEYDSEIYTDYPSTDILGKPYLDTAGRPFIPGRGIQRGDRVLNITRNERFFEDRAETYAFKVNSIEFKGYQPGYAFSMPPRASEVWLGPTKYWRVTYKVLLRKRVRLLDGTYNSAFSPAKVLNAGMSQKGVFFVPGPGGVPGFGVPVPGVVPIIKFGMQINHPVLLNVDGFEETQIDPLTGQLKQTYLSFDEYESADLNQLLISGV